RWTRATALVLLVLVAIPGLLSGCASPPQVTDVVPAKGAIGVPSREPIRITFDRPMNRGSVNWRLKLIQLYKNGSGKELQGTSFRWLGGQRVELEHQALLPSTAYQVALYPDYKDARGVPNALRHSWVFTTEGPPFFSEASPSDGDQQVTPSTYIGLTFSRQMDLESMAQAVSISPTTRFTLERDPANPWRVLVVPDTLLESNHLYTVAVTSKARDVDGNQLPEGAAVSFTTGSQPGLQHWVGFVAKEPTGAPAGLWIVDDKGLPRELLPMPVSNFSWSSDGRRALVQSSSGIWLDEDLQGGSEILPFHATWAAYLAPGQGYAYLDGSNLYTLAPSGQPRLVETGVGSAAVDPSGTRIAFTSSNQVGSSVSAYDVGLRTDYRLGTETAPVDGLSWSPDGLSLAYRVLTPNPAKHQIRVRLLRDAGTTSTVATGPVSAPVWQADSRHVYFTVPVRTSAGQVSRLFRATAGEPPLTSFTAASGLPNQAGFSVGAVSPSPDGRQIAFLSGSPGHAGQVWLMNADGTGLTLLTSFARQAVGYQATALSWTPS
ncbi:MAG: Ig-like domain-containing protein, partial [Candidatus Dormibacteraeota bacterium]|nr:Ig-like domain-containing protein [Candidatus Dormibacteraeota bacterium]